MVGRASVLNDPPQVLEGSELLHDLIHFQKHDDACAIDFTIGSERRRYSYREVYLIAASLVSRIEHILAAEGSRKGQLPKQHVIPVLLPQSPGLYISQLAILSSGGAFCPINLDAPQDRIKFVVGDVSANLIITTSEFKDTVSWDNGPTVIIVEEFPILPKEQEATVGSSREVKSNDLAYVMYTSGSTGTPKGVAVSHLAVCQSLLAHEKLLPRFKRFLQFAAPSFDVSVFEIFFPLTRGCTVVGCNRSKLLNDLPGMITELDVDAAELTPTVAGSLLQKRSNAPKLTLLLTIGEMLTRPIIEEFGGSDARESMLYGMYGPTEAAIHCTIHPRMEASAKSGNIGVPFETVSAFIAAPNSDSKEAETLNFLPTGELGELVLGGSQLAQGYLNREEQNKAAFIHCGGKSYYRTGDKARFLEDGSVEIFGRISAGQIKLRGQRIELGEIEEAVYKHPGIKTVAVIVLGSALVVFALTNDQATRPEEVMETCAKWLPKFMVPGEIVLLQSFPYLPSGKVDKRRLEADYQSSMDNEGGNDVSATSTDLIVKETLRSLLGLFSRNTRLATAGLDSLVAIRVASKLRASGFNVTPIAVLQADTVSELIKLCETAEMTSAEQLHSKSVPTVGHVMPSLNGKAKSVVYTMPCTPLQSAMLSETAIHRKAYMNWVELDIRGITDSNLVISALENLAEYNPILRTGFVESDDADGFVQIVWKKLSSSRIEKVKQFKYEFDLDKDLSLHRPLHIQIQNFDLKVKVLIHLHHALYDAWSLELLLDDLDTLLTGVYPKLRPPFSNFAAAYLNGTLKTDASASKNYWKDHLSNLDLRQVPNFHSTKITSSNLAVARLETSISTSNVDSTAKSMSSSPQCLFQAAYALILSSYVGTSDVCFGTVFSGRTLPIVDVEEIVGPCLATLPVRIDVAASATIRDLVQDLNSLNRKHLEHSAVPLRDIKSAGGVHPRQPLFDTLFIWQQTLHSYDHTRAHVFLSDSLDNLEFGLTIEVVPGTGNVELKANYRKSIFPASQIDLLLKQMEQLVGAIVQTQNFSLDAAFGHFTKDLLSIENEHPQTALKPGTLSSPVERIASEDPDRPAIRFATSLDTSAIQSQWVSYSELNSRANQLGHYLLSQGVLPDELVCICMEKSVDLYVAILSAAKAGVGYLPATPDTPAERLEYILGAANIKIILAKSRSQPLPKYFNHVKVVYLDETKFTELSRKDIPPRSSPDNLSYCVFTSGSTGVPKGVLVTQGNLLSNLDVLEDLYPATKQAKLLQSCSQAFDVSAFEIFFTWRIGGCLCSAVKDVLFQDIENAIRALEVTHLSLTPTVAALIDPRNVPGVQFLVTAGEAVTPKVFNAWADRGLYQGYGPSETTNICTVKPKVSLRDWTNNIGPPFKNTSAFVLLPGPDFAPVPRGGEGEFCFGGSQVFRGYMDQSQNVGKVIKHPAFGRLYRSGDFGRLMPDGSLAFTGRKDGQVKIRGQRVELGEIDNTMLKSIEVRDSVTILMGRAIESSQRLVCFWTPRLAHSDQVESLPPDRFVLASLYKSLETALPSYMVPSALIPVSNLPLTSQGKIDKRFLSRLYEGLDIAYLDSTARASRVPSKHIWTDIERNIAQALAECTKVSIRELDPDTSFFNLGIDSISAITFSRILRERFRCHVDISEILKFPSIVSLAETVSSRSISERPSPNGELDFGFPEDFLVSTADDFRKAGRVVKRILPCTSLQEAMLSAAQSRSENLYKNVVIFNVRGSLGKLKSCWQILAQRHEILRTCFVATDNPQYAYAQVILEGFKPRFEMLENPGGVSQTSVTPRITDPPYSLGLFQSKKSTKLVISMHHALYDGIALEVLYEEVEKLYHDESLPPTVSFAPFLSHILAMKMEDADRFWRETLIGCLPTRIKRIKSDLPNQTSIHRRHAIPSLRWISDRIKENGTSLLAVFNTVWAAIVSEYYQQTDVCFGNVVSGRNVAVEGIERLVAPCFNTIPTRLQDTHKLTYLEAFRKMQSFNANSLPFQLTPLRRIQSKFSPDGLRLFDTLFILQQPPRDLDSSIWSLSEDNGTMDFPLVCEVVPIQSENVLEIILHSHSSFIGTGDAITLIDSFNTKLQAALESPRRQLLSSTVKEQILSMSMNRDSTRTTPQVRRQPTSMTPEELEIREIISSFTDIPADKIDKDISIFRLGLDSINAVQVAARLRKQGQKVIASDILEHPSIAQLSSFLTQNGGIAIQAETAYDFATFEIAHRDLICSRIGIPSENVEAVRPCTAVQQGMIAQTLHSRGEEYVNSMWFDLLPHTSIPQLKKAWSIVRRENAMLRSGFVQTDDPKDPFALVTYTDLSFALPWFGEEEIIPELSTTDVLARRPWNLSVKKTDSGNKIKFTAHHALYDAQSIQMILSDVAQVYYSKKLVTRPNINSLLGPILVHERDEIQKKECFWQREENKIVVSRFPSLTPLQISETKTSVREVFSQVRRSGIEELCRDKGVTVQAAGQAAWARLLSAYSGESRNTFGIILSGRSVSQEADAIPFPAIVTLPVSCDVIGTNQDLLSRTMRTNASLHKDQFTPLTSIQKWAGFPEGRVFDTLFAYQKLPDTQEVNHPPWKVVSEEANADYAVSLEVQPTKSGYLALRLTFRENLIPAEHADILLKQYDALLLDILRNPEGACDDAPEIETHLLSITPARESTLPGSVSLLHEFLERGASQYPDKKALEFATCLEQDNFQSQFWTYKEVNEEGNKIAQLLCKRGIVPGQMIAICFEKCAEASFAILGILKSGCAYVALDPNAPQDRVRFIMNDSEAKLILTAGKSAHNLKSLDVEVVNLDSPNLLKGYPSHPPILNRSLSPEDISYCLYTSGTTGTPKGCLITHDNAVQAMYSFQRLFSPHWTESSKWLQFASFHFDVSVLEQFWSWSVGICVASAPRDLIFEDIPGAIQRLGITHIDLTPSLARLVHPDDVPTLCQGVFITGGEQLRQDILDVWGEHACIYNGYGPTEATIGCTMYPRVPKNGKPSNIGPQFDNVGSYVLRPNSEVPVLRGGIGELCVSGRLVGKGYLKRPNLTKERFPILRSFNQRVYRTGDLVRILHDGSFIFLGRADDQVKLRGQRLELSEINQVIKKGVEGAQEVVTLVLRHKSQQKEQLVAFFVPSSEDETHGALISKMREVCKAHLPGYMVPTHLIPIEGVPLNANNKADAKQLAALYDSFNVDELQKLSHSSKQDKEWTEKERPILDIIARILNIEASSLSRDVSIFELGIDSISIIGFSLALQTAGLVNVKLSVVKSNPVMEKLVGALITGDKPDARMVNAYLSASQEIAAFAQRHLISICQEIGVESTAIETIAPCTPVQEGMIYRFFKSQHALYFHSFFFRLNKGIDAKELLAAWKRVVMRLEILRTKFVATDDGYAQVVMKYLDIPEDQITDYENMEKSVALENPCSFSINATPSGTIVSLRIFHGLYDGNSLNMMLRRVVDEYHGLEGIEYGPSFHSALQYGPLVKLPDAERFWRSHLEDWTYQSIPSNLEKEADDLVAPRVIKGLDGFESLRRNLGVTHQAVIQAAWISVLQGIMSPVLTIGMVTSGRTIDFDGAEKVIGPLFNTLPFHIKVHAGMKASSLISKCHDLNMEMLDFQHTPLKDIQKWSPARPGQSLFNTLFVFLRPELDGEDFAENMWTQSEEEQKADV
jgi:amino acid adenylation domain-containing protein